MADGAEVRTSEELKNHFDIESVVGYFIDGRLISWLHSRRCEVEADKVERLEKNDLSLHEKLCEIFGVESTVKKIDIDAKTRRTKRLNKLKQYTYDKEILENVDLVAFNQSDLDELIGKGESVIYLCHNEFDIPLAQKKNKTYIGIGKAVAVIHSSIAINFERLNIKFKNVVFDDNYTAVLNAHNFHKKLYDEGIVAYEKQDYTTALKKFAKSADAGYPKAFSTIGRMYLSGKGVEVNVDTARNCFKRGIDKGDGNSFGFYASFLTADNEEDLSNSLFESAGINKDVRGTIKFPQQ